MLNNNGRITEAVDKITSLESVLSETEERVQQIQSSREGIARTETRLVKMAEDIDRQMDLLARLTKEDLAKNPKTPENRLSRHDRETIVALKRQGWNVTEIASRMKISGGEVELVLELGDIK